MHTGGLQAVSSKVKARGHFRTFAKRQGSKERVRLELRLPLCTGPGSHGCNSVA